MMRSACWWTLALGLASTACGLDASGLSASSTTGTGGSGAGSATGGATSSGSSGTASSGTGGAGGSSSPGGAGGGPGGSGGQGGALPVLDCPADEFATGFDGDGSIVCAGLAGTAVAAVNAQCVIYLGWRDYCDTCQDPPSKWGYAGASTCVNGSGGDNTCQTPTLGSDAIQLFGLSPDGNVDNWDRFYLGLRCAAVDGAPLPGPCLPGQHVSAVHGDGSVECVPVASAAVSYVRDHCSVYLGWRDICNGCTDDPSKWGWANQTSCQDGAGSGNTCTTPNLDGHTVPLFSLSTDGDVNGDDKFHFGFHCQDVVDDTASATESCPAGMLVTAVNSDGSLQCRSPSVLLQDEVRTHCFVYAGWRDSCDGCTDPPTKWGRVWHNGCSNGAGSDNTCTAATLGNVSVALLGLNTDNGVDGNDKFYLGLTCI